MSQPTDRPARQGAARIAVDRVACTGHGICAQLLPEVVTLDEWGYPIVRAEAVGGRDAATAVTLCPARALYRQD